MNHLISDIDFYQMSAPADYEYKKCIAMLDTSSSILFATWFIIIYSYFLKVILKIQFSDW